MRRLLALLFLAPALLLAQLQLVTVTGNEERETPVTGTLDLGANPVGTVTEMRLRLRNVGTATASITVLRAAGAGFGLTGQPLLPHILPSKESVDFSLRFAPSSAGSYAGLIYVNTATYPVVSTAAAAAQLGVRDGTTSVILSPDSTYSFGSLERGQTATRQFVIRNNTGSPLPVSRLSISGSAFTWTGAPAVPLTLAPQQEIAFDVVCAPVVVGVQQGSITLDQRTFPLNAISTELVFPRPLLEVDRLSAASGQQVKLSVKLAAASKLSGEGTLTVSAQPITAGLPDDSGMQFVSNSSRTVAFQIRPGDSQALFNGQPTVTLQTGTIAAALRVTAQLGPYTEQLTLPIPTAVPSIDTATTSRNDTSLQVQVAGFDNTRSLDKLAFTFYDVTGAAMPWGTVRLDAAAAFRNYFAGSSAGGLFLLRVDFPVSGSINTVGSVEVELSSGAGSSRTSRIKF